MSERRSRRTRGEKPELIPPKSDEELDQVDLAPNTSGKSDNEGSNDSKDSNDTATPKNEKSNNVDEANEEDSDSNEKRDTEQDPPNSLRGRRRGKRGLSKEGSISREDSSQPTVRSRRRGRPPKTAPATSAAEESGPSTEVPTKPVVKRKRGRPPKKKPKEESKETILPLSSGQSSVSSQVVDDTEADANRTDEDDANKTNIEDENDTEDDAPKEPLVVKRKRGRPRKHPKPSNDSTTKATAANKNENANANAASNTAGEETHPRYKNIIKLKCRHCGKLLFSQGIKIHERSCMPVYVPREEDEASNDAPKNFTTPRRVGPRRTRRRRRRRSFESDEDEDNKKNDHDDGASVDDDQASSENDGSEKDIGNSSDDNEDSDDSNSSSKPIIAVKRKGRRPRKKQPEIVAKPYICRECGKHFTARGINAHEKRCMVVYTERSSMSPDVTIDKKSKNEEDENQDEGRSLEKSQNEDGASEEDEPSSSEEEETKPSSYNCEFCGRDFHPQGFKKHWRACGLKHTGKKPDEDGEGSTHSKTDTTVMKRKRKRPTTKATNDESSIFSSPSDAEDEETTKHMGKTSNDDIDNDDVGGNPAKDAPKLLLRTRRGRRQDKRRKKTDETTSNPMTEDIVENVVDAEESIPSISGKSSGAAIATKMKKKRGRPKGSKTKSTLGKSGTTKNDTDGEGESAENRSVAEMETRTALVASGTNISKDDIRSKNLNQTASKASTKSGVLGKNTKKTKATSITEFFLPKGKPSTDAPQANQDPDLDKKPKESASSTTFPKEVTIATDEANSFGSEQRVSTEATTTTAETSCVQKGEEHSTSINGEKMKSLEEDTDANAKEKDTDTVDRVKLETSVSSNESAPSEATITKVVDKVDSCKEIIQTRPETSCEKGREKEPSAGEEKTDEASATALMRTTRKRKLTPKAIENTVEKSANDSIVTTMNSSSNRCTSEQDGGIVSTTTDNYEHDDVGMTATDNESKNSVPEKKMKLAHSVRNEGVYGSNLMEGVVERSDVLSKPLTNEVSKPSIVQAAKSAAAATLAAFSLFASKPKPENDSREKTEEGTDEKSTLQSESTLAVVDSIQEKSSIEVRSRITVEDEILDKEPVESVGKSEEKPVQTNKDVSREECGVDKSLSANGAPANSESKKQNEDEVAESTRIAKEPSQKEPMKSRSEKTQEHVTGNLKDETRIEAHKENSDEHDLEGMDLLSSSSTTGDIVSSSSTGAKSEAIKSQTESQSSVTIHESEINEVKAPDGKTQTEDKAESEVPEACETSSGEKSDKVEEQAKQYDILIEHESLPDNDEATSLRGTIPMRPDPTNNALPSTEKTVKDIMVGNDENVEQDLSMKGSENNLSEATKSFASSRSLSNNTEIETVTKSFRLDGEKVQIIEMKDLTSKAVGVPEEPSDVVNEKQRQQGSKAHNNDEICQQKFPSVSLEVMNDSHHKKMSNSCNDGGIITDLSGENIQKLGAETTRDVKESDNSEREPTKPVVESNATDKAIIVTERNPNETDGVETSLDASGTSAKGEVVEELELEESQHVNSSPKSSEQNEVGRDSTVTIDVSDDAMVGNGAIGVGEMVVAKSANQESTVAKVFDDSSFPAAVVACNKAVDAKNDLLNKGSSGSKSIVDEQETSEEDKGCKETKPGEESVQRVTSIEKLETEAVTKPDHNEKNTTITNGKSKSSEGPVQEVDSTAVEDPTSEMVGTEKVHEVKILDTEAASSDRNGDVHYLTSSTGSADIEMHETISKVERKPLETETSKPEEEDDQAKGPVDNDRTKPMADPLSLERESNLAKGDFDPTTQEESHTNKNTYQNPTIPTESDSMTDITKDAGKTEDANVSADAKLEGIESDSLNDLTDLSGGVKSAKQRRTDEVLNNTSPETANEVRTIIDSLIKSIELKSSATSVDAVQMEIDAIRERCSQTKSEENDIREVEPPETQEGKTTTLEDETCLQNSERRPLVLKSKEAEKSSEEADAVPPESMGTDIYEKDIKVAWVTMKKMLQKRGASKKHHTDEFDSKKLDRVKMMLYVAGSKVHRGRGFERIFGMYWEAITLRLSGPLSMNSAKRCDFAISSFLKSGRLRKIHNKFVMSIMRRALKTRISLTGICGHVPLEWQERVKILQVVTSAKTTPKKYFGFKDVRKELLQLTSVPHFDESMPYKEAWDLPSESLNNEGRNPQEGPAEPVASSCIPGALVVDPFLRDTVESNGMKVTDSAMWLLTVAVKEHIKNLLSDSIEFKKGLKKGEIYPQAIHYPNVLASNSTKSKRVSKAKNSGVSLEGNRKKQINSIDIFAALNMLPSGRTSSIGGSTSRMSLEHTFLAAFNSMQPFNADRTFTDVRRFILREITSAAKESKQTDERQAPTSGKSGNQNSSREKSSEEGTIKTPPVSQIKSIESISSPIPNLDSPALANGLSPSHVQTPGGSAFSVNNEKVSTTETPKKNAQVVQNPIIESGAPRNYQTQNSTGTATPLSVLPPASLRTGAGRGAKNLAALMARATETNLQTDTPAQISGAKETDQSTAKEIGALGNMTPVNSASQPNTEVNSQAESVRSNPITSNAKAAQGGDSSGSVKLQSNVPVRRGSGKGFGSKDLAAIRARSMTASRIEGGGGDTKSVDTQG